MTLATRPFERGLQDIGTDTWAWLQPDGSWGWSNAGLVTDGDQSLLVDTLFDVPLTAEMLAVMRDAAPAAGKIDTVVNTHANGDHCNGNQLAEGAEIIASTACAEELAEDSPKRLAAMQAQAPQMGLVGEFFMHCFSAFDFASVEQTLPTRTFDGRLDLAVGNRPVELIEVGPAHTRGDVLVHVPDAATVFTGDILFIEGHPIMWVGPVGNWIDACQRILDMNADVVVPGHGPITDNRGVLAVKQYLEYVRDEARKRFDAGMSAREAALDINMSDYDSWGDGERIVVNVHTLYREFSGAEQTESITDLFALMAELHRDRRGR